MQTTLSEEFINTPLGNEAAAILRKCVHCGFCLATCPTYNLVGDELDSPRGRIYLMKQMLEGAPVTERTQHHLDRCLTCRSCESTCPSGVEYGKLVDIGREIVEQKVTRPPLEKFKRALLKKILPNAAAFRIVLKTGQTVKGLAGGLMPEALARKVPSVRLAGTWPPARHPRRMLVLQGCVQPAIAPDINAATARVLDAIGISLITASAAGCCGAVAHHLGDVEGSRAMARANIDAWLPLIEQGTEAIIITASGCGTAVSDYGHLLQHDTAYAAKGARISALCRDISEVIAQESVALQAKLTPLAAPKRIAFHSPCSLQHGLKIKGKVEALLTAAGYTLTAVPDGHLCCGSAGTYSILQAELSKNLLANKVAALESDKPNQIVTANIGCLAHIESGLNQSSKTPIDHWIALLAERIA
jgi:glycolate oxidase iron-sulfur subunit